MGDFLTALQIIVALLTIVGALGAFTLWMKKRWSVITETVRNVIYWLRHSVARGWMVASGVVLVIGVVFAVWYWPGGV